MFVKSTSAVLNRAQNIDMSRRMISRRRDPQKNWETRVKRKQKQNKYQRKPLVIRLNV